ncbi:DUF2975 domain-containing protein [Massilia antarctica]|uniref:DUF2975 domain-containing protein n=1 Tax=Massilia antarctica TaxID=2765360 RepID=UPI00226FAFB0|nr:DUF2975 domain-containing protein [Massilia sp. H27-R4]MCY0912669.1 DUF2975 domain-containing protein [Massilia sp. H27-R4]
MKMMSNHAKISRLARYSRWALTLALGCGALMWGVLTWLVIDGQFGPLSSASIHLASGVGLLSDLDKQLLAAHPILLWGYGTLALGITGYGVLRLLRLMRMYESGAVFDRRAPAHLAAFAVCIAARELLDTLALPLLAMGMGDSSRPMNMRIDSSTVHVLLITFLFFLMSHIMAAAYVVADDNEKII